MNMPANYKKRKGIQRNKNTANRQIQTKPRHQRVPQSQMHFKTTVTKRPSTCSLDSSTAVSTKRGSALGWPSRPQRSVGSRLRKTTEHNMARCCQLVTKHSKIVVRRKEWRSWYFFFRNIPAVSRIRHLRTLVVTLQMLGNLLAVSNASAAMPSLSDDIQSFEYNSTVGLHCSGNTHCGLGTPPSLWWKRIQCRAHAAAHPLTLFTREIQKTAWIYGQSGSERWLEL